MIIRKAREGVNNLSRTHLVILIPSTILVCNKQSTNIKIKQELRDNKNKSNFTLFDNPPKDSYSTSLICIVDNPSKFLIDFLFLGQQQRWRTLHTTLLTMMWNWVQRRKDNKHYKSWSTREQRQQICGILIVFSSFQTIVFIELFIWVVCNYYSAIYSPSLNCKKATNRLFSLLKWLFSNQLIPFMS